MLNEITAQTTELIRQDFALPVQSNTEGPTEQELLDQLSAQIFVMIENELEPLLNLLYRLDIDERDIDRAFNPENPEDVHVSLAKAVLERQKRRVYTKRNYRQPPIVDQDHQDIVI